jgi:3-methylfumaryl-CoA hydratase
MLLPDERLLFRYSSITDNPHRIHYDQPYATGQEGYPALVVNGSIPAMFLLELFRTAAGKEPVMSASRNLAPMLCGRPLLLSIARDAERWRVWAENDAGVTTFEAVVE